MADGLLSKIKPVPFLAEKLILPCEWEGCDFVETEVEAYCNHVEKSHLPSIMEDNLHCQWQDCEGFTDTVSELRRHVMFHTFHTKIKGFGQNLQQRMKLQRCHLDVNGHNMIPELPDPFICSWDDCTKEFEDPEFYYRHVDYHACCFFKREKSSITKCLWSGCFKEMTDLNKLKDHCRFHTQEKVIACPTCGGMFASRTKFVQHIHRQLLVDGEGLKVIYTCEYCSHKVGTKKLLQDHLRVHVNHYKCPYCHMTCNTPSSLQTHIMYLHSDEKPEICQYCDYRCKKKNDLRKHLETHSLDPTHNCSTKNCSYSTRSYTCLKRHISHVHEGQVKGKYSCHLCPKITTRGNYLTKHLISKHNFCWPSGHTRFRYHKQSDGFYRMQTVRYESVEFSDAVVCDNPESLGTINGLEIQSIENSVLYPAERIHASTNEEISDRESALVDDPKIFVMPKNM